MRMTVIGALATSVVVFVLVPTVAAQNQREERNARAKHETPPYWAFALNPPAEAAQEEGKPVDETPIHVAGSAAAFHACGNW